MKLVFVSNYFNHHQKPICDSFYNLLGEEFRFVATTTVPEMRRALGYGTEDAVYVVPAYAGAQFRTLAQTLIDEADVVIAGAAPQSMLQSRLRTGKLVFRYSERPLKDGFSVLKYFPRLVRWHLRNPMSKPIYMLCASAYTAPDYAKFGLFRNRCYKWGYFPETKRYENIDALMDGKATASILWVGRLIDWKHPDDALEIARRLRQEGYRFAMSVIGNGEMERELLGQVAEYALEDSVCLYGPMKPEEVRAHMEKAGIFLFTSDRKEGWGAVLNEAMNSGCAVVASDAIGAVPYLARHRENGMIYPSGNVDELYEQVKYLLDHPAEQKRLGTEAYRTITEEWNAEIAAERFVALAQQILTGKRKNCVCSDGPCSKHGAER